MKYTPTQESPFIGVKVENFQRDWEIGCWFADENNRQFAYTSPQIVEIAEFATVPPLMRGKRIEGLQRLVDDLWRLGIRPTQVEKEYYSAKEVLERILEK